MHALVTPFNVDATILILHLSDEEKAKNFKQNELATHVFGYLKVHADPVLGSDDDEVLVLVLAEVQVKV